MIQYHKITIYDFNIIITMLYINYESGDLITIKRYAHERIKLYDLNGGNISLMCVNVIWPFYLN